MTVLNAHWSLWRCPACAASTAPDTCSPLVPLRLSLRSSLFSSFWLLLVTLHMDMCTWGYTESTRLYAAIWDNHPSKIPVH